MAESLWIKDRLAYLSRISFTKAAVYVLIPIFYIYLPVAAVRFGPHPFLLLLLFFVVNAAIVIVLCRDAMFAANKVRFQCEDLEGKMNLQEARNAETARRNVSLNENIRRYASLKKVVEGINHELNTDSVCDRMCQDAFTLVAREKGTCILYVSDTDSQCLRLRNTRKEDRKLIIKAKQGDIFDQWVMMHVNPLLIEDISKDFRFDLDRVAAPDSRPIRSLISSPLISGGSFLGILRLDHPDPGYYDLDDLRFLRSISDLGALALENALLYSSTQELAIHDGLTQVFTKSYFLEMLKLECRRCLRSGKQFALLMIDIDHFKQYNDQYGHIAGDIVLKNLAAKMVSLLGSRGCAVSRFGGEEFCVIVPGVDRAAAVETAELLRGAVEKESFVLRRKPTAVTISVGVAMFPEVSTDETELLMKADKAMYEAKQGGRNRVVTVDVGRKGQ